VGVSINTNADQYPNRYPDKNSHANADTDQYTDPYLYTDADADQHTDPYSYTDDKIKSNLPSNHFQKLYRLSDTLSM